MTEAESNSMTEADTDTDTALSALRAPEAAAEPAPAHAAPALTLGFARGVAPSKWQRRWAAASPGRQLEVVPVDVTFGRDSGNAVARAAASEVDMMIERALPGEIPEGITETVATDKERHSMQLYVESISLVLPIDHELAEESSLDVRDLGSLSLLDHPHHSPQWPAPEPWQDAAFMPKSMSAALQLVAAGVGGMLVPHPLARHLMNKREMVLIPLTGNELLAGSTMWATWSVDRNSSDVQQLAGILRGRSAGSSRTVEVDRASIHNSGAGQGDDTKLSDQSSRNAGSGASRSKQSAAQPQKKAPKLKPNSRGAQLAAAKEKSLRKKRDRKRK